MTRTPPGNPPPEPDGTDAEPADAAPPAPSDATEPRDATTEPLREAQDEPQDEPGPSADDTAVDTADVEPAADLGTTGTTGTTDPTAAASAAPDVAGQQDDPGDPPGRPADEPADTAGTAGTSDRATPPREPDGPDAGDADDQGTEDAAAPDVARRREDAPARPAVQHGRHGAPTLPEPGGLRALGRALRPRAGRSQIIVGVLCALLGFALVAQVSQTQEDQLSSLRQSDLVRLLDDVTQRSGELEEQVASLEATRDELRSGSGRERAALEVAREQEQTQGILSGRLPAQGPGVEIEVAEGEAPLDAFLLFNVLEELRNAGAEAMEVNGVRLVASSYFEDSPDGVVVDGQTLASPYRWTVIGDPSTLETALEIPGGAMASLRSEGARTTIRQLDQVEVTATREPAAPRYATPVPAEE
ncbi:DUF881 domain-containing protein [Cellulosimicrobium cellulans]|uniref:DUF881 domain-containing protein n=1 Tax=Cellulosimicrobium cellulans TaxID=1710 RepID=UPI000A6A8D29|nr:DUF881 domain-containing protein [Cellulosimicrobium cellulans]